MQESVVQTLPEFVVFVSFSGGRICLSVCLSYVFFFFHTLIRDNWLPPIENKRCLYFPLKGHIMQTDFPMFSNNDDNNMCL